MVAYRVTGGTFQGESVTELTGHNITLSMIAQQLPMQAKVLRSKLGVCVHPNFDNTVWEHNAAWTQQIADVGFQNIRGMVATNLPLVQEALTNAKHHKLKWLAQVASIKQNTTNAQIDARLNYIKQNIGDFVGIEGPNEPDKDGLTDAEVTRTVAIMRRIKDFVQENNMDIPVLSPALRMPADRAMYQRFVNAGIIGTFDVVSLHHYFGDQNVNPAEAHEKISWVSDVWKCQRFWISETGRTTALNAGPDQRPPISELAQAKMIVRDFLTLLQVPKVEKVFLYEGLDDPNAAKDDTEKNFGFIKVATTEPATWAPKLAHAPLMQFLSTIYDVDTDISLHEVDLEVHAPDGVYYTLVQRNDGQTYLWLFRPDATVWWGETDRDVDPEPVDVVIYSHLGESTVQVGGAAVGVLVE